MMNFLNPATEKPLYSKVLNISVKGLASDDTRYQKLTLNLEWLPNSSSHKKVLVIHLTDTNDPFFYFMANISEDNFVNMKHQQDLLVDFPSFSEMFTNLLEQCIAEDAKPQPKLVLSLYMDSNSEVHRTAVLDVVEKNRFKHIVHLSLLLPEVNNTLQKQYITTCYRNMKEGKERLESRLSSVQQDLSKQLQNCEETNSHKIHELEQILKKREDELSKKEQKVKDELRRLKDDLSRKHRDDVFKLENKLKQKDDYHRRGVIELEAKVKCLEGINEECSEKLNRKSREIRELKLKFDAVQNKLNEAQNRLQVLTGENENLETLIAKKKQKIVDISRETCALQIRINEHEVTVAHLRRNLESVSEEKDNLHHQLLKFQSECLKKERTEKELRADREKSNEILRKHIKQVKEMKEQLQNKENAVLKRDDVIAKKTEQCKHLENRMASVMKHIAEEKQEVESIKNKFESMEAKLKEYEETIFIKTNIIKHLDMQLLHRSLDPEQDIPLNEENTNKGFSTNEAANQVAKNHSLDNRYLQRHHPLPQHNPVEDDEPSYLQEVYAKRAFFQPFAQHFPEPADRSSKSNNCISQN